MDPERFLGRLPELYENWNQDSVRPKSNQFQDICDQIPSMTTANILQLLNWAVSCLDGDEIYCEIGTYLGSTLIGSLINHHDRTAYAVDNFAEYNPQGDNFEHLLNHITAFALEDQIYFYDQDFEAFFFEFGELENKPEIGVYFYDGAHDYRSVLLGLLLARPFLARNALIILDDYNWDTVQQASWDFIATHSACQSILEIFTPVARYPTFWNGIQVICWNPDRAFNYAFGELEKRRKFGVIRDIYDLQMREQHQESVKALYHEAQYWHQHKNYSLAKEKYQLFLNSYTEDAKAWLNFGILLYETAYYQEALAAFVKVTQIDKENGIPYFYLGLTFEKSGRIHSAIEAYQAATKIQNPKRIEAYNNLGNLLLEQGAFDRAEQYYREAIKLHPNHSGSYLNLGSLLLETGNIVAAIELYQHVLKSDNQNLDISHNLELALTIQHNPGQFYFNNGNNFYYAKSYVRANQQYQMALKFGFNLEEVYLKSIECLNKLGQNSEIIKQLRLALSTHPDSEECHFRLITILFQSGNPGLLEAAEVAVKCLPKSYTLKLFYHLLLPLTYQSQAEIEFYHARFQEGLNRIEQEINQDIRSNNVAAIENAFAGIGRFTTFYLTYQARNIRQEQQQYAAIVQSIMQVKYPQWSKDLTMPTVGDKIRIGYFSNYLHAYSGTFWLTGWFKYFDQNRFEIYCYYTGNSPDAVTQHFEKYSYTFHYLEGNLETICHQIFNDRLHILVFPEIGMNPQTLQVAALRLAPIQCTAWGHPVTSGLSTIDYYLSSQLMEPEDAQEHYTETLIHLPNTGVTYPKPEIPQPTLSRQDFGLHDDSIVYLCCQAPFKYLPHHDVIFPEIARKVPQVQFVFLRADVLKPRLKKAFAALELHSEDYCLFLPVQARNDYLTLNLHADIYLDTIGFTGGNTTFDAIACGLPIVTYPGKLMRGRLSYGMLNKLGVTETIAHDIQSYIDIAVRLGLDTNWRQHMATKMLQNHEQLYEDLECVRALEDFYTQTISGNNVKKLIH